MQYRALGRTGASLSVIGFGGILLLGRTQAEADRFVASAVERGVNYFDVAPKYGDGEAEEKMGPALVPHRRNVFLACKSRERSAEGAKKDLERSLRRLRTDRFDLYQIHGVPSMQEAKQVLGPGGALEALLRAREEGKARYLGFSAHSAEAAVELLRRFPFDSALFPLNFAAYLHGNFGPQVVEAAQRAGAGILALKAMAHTHRSDGLQRESLPWSELWYQPLTDEADASLALRFTLSLPVTAAIPPGNPNLWEIAVRVARDPRPLSADEDRHLSDLAARTAPLFTAAGA